MVNILIVDDHEMIRKGLVAVFAGVDDINVIGEASNGDEALVLVDRYRPDLVLLDMRMPGKDGVATALEIKDENPEIKIVILSAVDDPGEVLEAVEAKIDGYISKNASSDDLIRAVMAVLGGDKYLDPSVAGHIMNEVGRGEKEADGKRASLTEREHDVLRLMALGYKNREIASKLFLGDETVKTHVSKILVKLDQPNRVQAVFYALRTGLIKLDEK